MKPVRIAPDASVEELARIALSVHNVVCRMPVAVKTRCSPGVLVEDGEFILSARECQPLECMFAGEEARRIHIGSGKYAGTTMFASAIVSPQGERIAALGVIDTLGILSLEIFVADRESIDWQLGSLTPGDKHLIHNRR